MGWLIALAVILASGFLPVGISARYDSDGAVANLIAGPVRVRLYPKNAAGKPKKEKKPKQEQDSAKSGSGQGSGNKGGSYRDFLPVLKIVLEFLEEFRTKLRVKRLELKCILASDDPCDLALNYARAWAAIGNLVPHLERFLVIKSRDIAVECDFTATQTVVYSRVDLTVTVGRLLRMALWHGVRVIYHYLKIINQRKGGANT